MTAAAAAGGSRQQPANGTKAHSTPAAVTHPSNGATSGLGPVIPDEGPWAEAAQQLRMAPQAQQGQASPAASVQAVKLQQRGAAAAVDTAGAAAGVAVPGAVKPRGGARRAALGPLLARLRQQDAS
jgi:hypothetical protein